jgi:hypothetical protein
MDFAVNRNHALCGDLALEDVVEVGYQVDGPDGTGEIDLCAMNKTVLRGPVCEPYFGASLF